MLVLYANTYILYCSYIVFYFSWMYERKNVFYFSWTYERKNCFMLFEIKLAVLVSSFKITCFMQTQ